jgi:hypothetical protein
MRREIEVTEFLHAQGAPVVAPSTELPPGPHRHDGFAVSFWPFIESDPDRTVTAADCADAPRPAPRPRGIPRPVADAGGCGSRRHTMAEDRGDRRRFRVGATWLGVLEMLDALDPASAVDPQRLAGCRRLRSLQVALCLLVLREDFADVDGWDQGIEGCVGSLAEPGRGD